MLLERLEHKADEIAERIHTLQQMENELRALRTLGLTFPVDDVDGKPEGLAFTPKGQAVIALDQKDTENNLLLMNPAIAPG